ncbi:MAG: hypothetical protein ACHQRM_09390 [Bacteroidia bacterium]
MNLVHPNTVPINQALKRVLLSLICVTLLTCTVHAAPVTQDLAAVTAARSTAVQDSIRKEQESAAEAEELQRKEKVNTILEVVGSVVAIVGLVFLTWKFSAGSGKQSKTEKHQNAPHSGIRR